MTFGHVYTTNMRCLAIEANFSHIKIIQTWRASAMKLRHFIKTKSYQYLYRVQPHLFSCRNQRLVVANCAWHSPAKDIWERHWKKSFVCTVVNTYLPSLKQTFCSRWKIPDVLSKQKNDLHVLEKETLNAEKRSINVISLRIGRSPALLQPFTKNIESLQLEDLMFTQLFYFVSNHRWHKTMFT